MAEIGVIYHRQKQAHLLERFQSCLQSLSLATGASCFLFGIGSFDQDRKTAHGTLIRASRTKETTAPVPSHICNFALHTSSAGIAKMRQLRTSPAHFVLNPVNRFHQLMVFEMLLVLPGAEVFVPRFREFDPFAALQGLAQADSLLILPEHVGHRSTGTWVQTGTDRCLLQAGAARQWVRADGVARQLQVIHDGGKRLLLQLPQVACTADGLPLEARVYVQKGAGGRWLAVQTAAKQELFIRQGAEPGGCPLSEQLAACLPDRAEVSIAKLKRMAVLAAAHLDRFIPSLGALTFDFMIGQDGNPLLTAVSGCEQGDVLRAACGDAAWEAYVRRSLTYGLELCRQHRKGRTD